MIAYNVTPEILEEALRKVNEIYDNNIIFFIGPEKIGRRYKFRLGVASSKGPGSRIGISGRRISAACWHVHRDFFIEVFKVKPKAKFRTMLGIVTSESDWPDYTIGPIIGPQYKYSQLCNC